MTWREVSGDQNLRMANLMLEQAGKLTDAEAQAARLSRELAALEQDKATLVREYANLAREAQLLADQRDRLLVFLGVEARTADAGCHLYAGEVIERAMDIMITDPRDEESHGA
jgi:hypothetical protein